MTTEEDRRAATRSESPPEDAPAREPRDRVPFDKVLPELLKRGLSAGRDVGESFFPKDFATNLAAQLVDARHGLVSAIANEVGRFLRQADIASEVRKVLAGLNVEAKVQLRFSEDESGKLHSRVNVEPPDPTAKSKPKSIPPEEK